MVDSIKLDKVKEEYNLFKEKASNDSYCLELFYLFEQALRNIDENHHEIAMFLFCVIIESIASKHKYEEYKTFDSWLLSLPGTFDTFLTEIKMSNEPKKVLVNYYKNYAETYGPRRNFIHIILETYSELNAMPSFMRIKTKKISDRIRVRIRTEEEYDIEEMKKEFRRSLAYVYDKCRSPFSHEAKKLPSSFKLNCERGGSFTGPEYLSNQDLAQITLEVMKLHLNKSI